MAESDKERDLKTKHGLGEHVRVSIRGSRPKRVTAPSHKGQANAPRGFGDIIARFTAAAGIKPCEGCRKRQAALNRVLPFRRSK